MSETATNPNSSQITTSTFLSHIRGKNVSVKLTSGLFYTGLLISIDGFMNVCLRDAKEYHEKADNGLLTAYSDDIILRGNQVNYIGEA